ncbi:MAG TPA: response regulator [Ktedonobacteraceae bacterium]|nr:response regulator [Ktedonobacteraceae bacterium]
MESRPRVLIVDDSPTICLFIAASLEQAGYDVEIALKGHEGLAKVKLFQPNCLILDVMLPDISGYAVCRHLQQSALQNMVYIILISSKNASLDQSYGLRQGAHLYLPKPFSAEAIVQAVWEGVPEPLRHTVRPSLSAAPQQNTPPALVDLIPRRVVNQGAMRTRNPFAFSPATEDKLARQLYAAIDGSRTIAELAAGIRLDARAIARPLHLLLEERCIEMYDAEDQLVEDAL